MLHEVSRQKLNVQVSVIHVAVLPVHATGVLEVSFAQTSEVFDTVSAVENLNRARATLCQ